VPAPQWFFRYAYDRESVAWRRRRDEPDQQAKVDDEARRLTQVVPAPGPLADLGCGPGAHALALARQGYEVVGLVARP
jgi:2-polyprenyl-3-methyl-5-hydroxy-6-metoxy-1,4-benzoquinol methylase